MEQIRRRINNGISIHALCEEGDFKRFYNDTYKVISIHALCEEGDQDFTEAPHTLAISIHALREEGDSSQIWESKQFSNFYPRPPRGGRLTTTWTNSSQVLISIHALREEGDESRLGTASIHWRFLSTPSARRATRNAEADPIP